MFVLFSLEFNDYLTVRLKQPLRFNILKCMLTYLRGPVQPKKTVDMALDEDLSHSDMLGISFNITINDLPCAVSRGCVLPCDCHLLVCIYFPCDEEPNDHFVRKHPSYTKSPIA